MAEVPRVERLIPEAQSAEEPSGRPGTGQLGIPVVRSAAGTMRVSRRVYEVGSTLLLYALGRFNIFA